MDKQITWQANMKQAGKLAKEEKKFMLIDFFNPQ
jgi:hypothetical protein